ncbi:MAG TPA: 50S ribosomal protein L11 methyltransferase [Vicinamibacterales bacterium]|nr:50S ribosomal protein L11 methyltransferase [Vicinamibacterales bacterium]
MRTWPALDIAQPDADDLIQAFLIDFNLAAVDDSRFFFHTHGDRDRAAAALRAGFPGIDARPVDVLDEDWAARSQAALRAIQIGSLIVAPPWDVQAGIRDPGSGVRTIVIQPSMGFGTGHHATTRLCLAALQEIDLRGRSVIDVGTGSGVLAIAARRLGASGVLGIDDDADAIAAAEENVALNRESRIALEVADLRASTIGQFDVVVANLTGALLVSTAPRLQSFTVSGGRLVLGGFLEEEERDVLAAFATCAVEARTQEDEWMCVTLRNVRHQPPTNG